MLLLFHILLFYDPMEVCITATLEFCLKGTLMTVKKISYFRSNPSTKETITILDCGYHETLHGHYSAQKVVDHFVLHIIVSGKGTYQLREQTYHLQKNDCFVLFPHVPICYQSDPQDPWVYYWVGFDGRDALEIMQLCNITYQIPILHYESTIELANILKPLIDLNTASISDSYFALGQFYSLCSRLMQYNQNIKPLSRKEYYVSQAVSLIENSYFKNISVQSISDAVGLERTYLYRIFKEITGVTIQEYLTDLKLKRARYFLTNSDFSCADIAYYCGYLSEQYFSMAFKKKTGLSPSLYRQKALSDRSFHAKEE